MNAEHVLNMMQSRALGQEAVVALFNTINRTQALLGAVFDLLTCQCDRHPENVVLSDAGGGISLIDNDWAFAVRAG